MVRAARPGAFPSRHASVGRALLSRWSRRYARLRPRSIVAGARTHRPSSHQPRRPLAAPPPLAPWHLGRHVRRVDAAPVAMRRVAERAENALRDEDERLLVLFGRLEQAQHARRRRRAVRALGAGHVAQRGDLLLHDVEDDILDELYALRRHALLGEGLLKLRFVKHEDRDWPAVLLPRRLVDLPQVAVPARRGRVRLDVVRLLQRGTHFRRQRTDGGGPIWPRRRAQQSDRVSKWKVGDDVTLRVRFSCLFLMSISPNLLIKLRARARSLTVAIKICY